MVSLKLSLSRHASTESGLSQKSNSSPIFALGLGGGGAGSLSASSSRSSLLGEEDENATVKLASFLRSKGKERSNDDLRLLALSTHMTELSYTISDIQTRIFEIQELRHQSHAFSDGASSGSSTSIIDQSLMNLDERLESVNRGMKMVNEAIEPLVNISNSTPKQSSLGGSNDIESILRKHATLLADWESVQDETDVLREELKEDKWLTVFRTVSEQADGMMSSLEKAVKRCQDFIWQVHRRGNIPDQGSPGASMSSEANAPINIDTFNSLLESFEAKKKHYMPATTKVLSIIDKGVQDRVTKNGECLRRHAESTQRWKTLKDRIARTDSEMETARRILIKGDYDLMDLASDVSDRPLRSSRKSKGNDNLSTPPTSTRGRASAGAMAFTRSISPLRKFAKKITSRSPAVTPSNSAGSIKKAPSAPASDPLTHRRSLFNFGRTSSSQTVPERHKHSQSYQDESPLSSRQKTEDEGLLDVETIKPKIPKWNSSTKVGADDFGVATIKKVTKKTSTLSLYRSGTSSQAPPPVPPLPRRSQSRSSFSSSRPWSPVTTSQASGTHSSQSVPNGRRESRPPSRSRARSPSMGGSTSRVRAKTPSNIPMPAWQSNQSTSDAYSEASNDDYGEGRSSSIMQRAFSTAYHTPHRRESEPINSSTIVYPPLPRPPSRSMIPIPSLHVSAASRPNTAMSSYEGDGEPESYRPGSSMSFRSSATRAQTPESALKRRASQVPFMPGSSGCPPAMSHNLTSPTEQRTLRSRPSLAKLPPSSFRDASVAPPTRPSSRATSVGSNLLESNPVHMYVPANPNDPLDAEVAAVVNSIAHGLLVERVDAPTKTSVRGKDDDTRGQYAFSSQLNRKVVVCKLASTMARGPNGQRTPVKKVMCRVGGGWQDLQLFMLNRLVGM